MHAGTTRISALRSRIDKALGRRETLKERDRELYETVAKAKGILLLKQEVNTFLETLQAEANERTTGTYGSLLSALITDVLPHVDGEVHLDLRTERGLPALDLHFAAGQGKLIDIMEGCGGAFTNIVSLGLRLIANTKSGLRRFVALDEPDCWIAPESVADFLRVISESCAKLGTQALVISHHSPTLFPPGTARAVIRTTKEDPKRIEIQNDETITGQWSDEAMGIRSIRLVNYMAHTDSMLALSPTVTALVGPNNLGKSVFMRALRAVCYAECDDSDIRHGAKRCEVHLRIESGLTLQFSREIKRNPVNLWRLVDADGSVVDVDGLRYETGGRSVPDWVPTILGVDRADGLDVQIGHQKMPVFLLGEPPSKRAAVLSIGKESGHISTMIAAAKQMYAENTDTVRSGEIELGRLRAELEAGKRIEDLPGQLDEAQATLDTARRHQEAGEKATHLHERLTALYQTREALEARSKVLETEIVAPDITPLLEANKAIASNVHRIETARRTGLVIDERSRTLFPIPDTSPPLASNADMVRVGRRLRDLQIEQQAIAALSSALADIATDPPVLIDVIPTHDMTSRLDRLRATAQAMEQDRMRADTDLVELEHEISQLVTSLGDACPLCGSHVEGDQILHHRHEG
jgi:hypothetical protein